MDPIKDPITDPITKIADNFGPYGRKQKYIDDVRWKKP